MYIYIWKIHICINVCMYVLMQNIHIYRHCLWSVGARMAPIQNWIHWYTEAQLLHGGTWVPMEKRDLMCGLQSPVMTMKTSPAGQWGHMLPLNYAEQTCRILNFPELHQLAEFIGNGSILYLLCMFLLGVWGTVRLIKHFTQQNWWLHLKESPLLPTPLFQHWNFPHIIKDCLWS